MVSPSRNPTCGVTGSAENEIGDQRV